jgi:hypothetical protein
MINNISTKLISAIGITLFTGVAQAAYQDIAVNGGFESGDFTGWTLFPGSAGAAGQQISTVNPSSGIYSANLTELAPAANVIKQANLLPGAWTIGQQIDIAFDYRGIAAAGAVLNVEIFTELGGGQEGVSSSVNLFGGPIFPNGNPDVWTSKSVSYDVLAEASGGVTLQFSVACAPIEGCNGDYFIDNVSISADVNAVPVPAAVWLFGSGLIGLVGIARKKKAA